MKSFANASFFWLFDHVIRPNDLLEPTSTWSREGVNWTHVRHTFRGVDYEFSTEVFTGTRLGKKGWSVMLVREGWWAGAKRDLINNRQWAHLTSGTRVEAMAWFQVQEAASRVATASASDQPEP